MLRPCLKCFLYVLPSAEEHFWENCRTDVRPHHPSLTAVESRIIQQLGYIEYKYTHGKALDHTILRYNAFTFYHFLCKATEHTLLNSCGKSPESQSQLPPTRWRAVASQRHGLCCYAPSANLHSQRARRKELGTASCCKTVAIARRKTSMILLTQTQMILNRLVDVC